MVDSLCEMFSEWDRESLGSVLETNNFHIERTIEACLAMSGDQGVPGGSSSTQGDLISSSPAPVTSSSPAPAPYSQSQYQGSIDSSIPGDIFNGGQDWIAPTTGPYSPSTSSSQAAPGRSVASSSLPSSKRGSSCQLPEAFLRAPGWRQGPTTPGGSSGAQQDLLPDEELARMLQDEMFQAQMQARMGQSGMYPPHGAGAGPPPGYGYGSRYPQQQQQQQQQYPPRQMQSQAASASRSEERRNSGRGSFWGFGRNTETTSTAAGASASPGPESTTDERRGSLSEMTPDQRRAYQREVEQYDLMTGQAGGGAPPPKTDLGIMSGLKNMGAAAKQRLSDMARSFSSKDGGTSRRNSRRQSRNGETQNGMVSLDDGDDDIETISFMDSHHDQDQEQDGMEMVNPMQRDREALIPSSSSSSSSSAHHFSTTRGQNEDL
jgi:hypothetical protein